MATTPHGSSTSCGAWTCGHVFLQGRWVEAFGELARRVGTDGHLIGNHSFYHARMPLLSDDGFEEDIREAQRAIIDATGVDPRPWLRFPFGAGADTAGLVDRLSRLGYRHVGWDVEVYEWEPGRSAREVVDAAFNGVMPVATAPSCSCILGRPGCTGARRDRRATARRGSEVRPRRRARGG